MPVISAGILLWSRFHIAMRGCPLPASVEFDAPSLSLGSAPPNLAEDKSTTGRNQLREVWVTKQVYTGL